jgi:hypothetical protein
MSPEVARLRHASGPLERPFVGVGRKSSAQGQNDAIDPTRKLPPSDNCRCHAAGKRGRHLGAASAVAV